MSLDVAAVCAPVARELERAIDEARAGDEPELAAKLARARSTVLGAVRAQLEQQRVAAASLPVPPTRANVVLAVELPIHTFSEANARGHWAQRFKQSGDQRPVVSMAMRAHANRRGLRVAPPCTVHLTRLAPTTLDDGDNLEMSLKHVRDGVADWLAINDRDARVQWVCAQQTTKHWGVRIEVLL